jgi:hypothetical protein
VLIFASAITAHAQPTDSSPTLSAYAPHPPKAQDGPCVADTDFMRRNHMKMLMHQRNETVHRGVRGKQDSLKNCVTCHAVKGDNGQFVKFSNPKHFCRSCHDYAAVSIDCFECHASRPEVAKNTTLDLDEAHNNKVHAELSRYLGEMEGQQ